jgi:putative tricarboxylic transport membrane protein
LLRRPADLGALALALGVTGLGVFYAVETLSIADIPGYARIGPTAFPAIVAAGLVAVGLALVWLALKPGGSAAREGGEAGGLWDWSAFAWVSGGLVAHLLLVNPAGFIPASTLLFAVVARAFGSRRLGRDLAVALALAVVVYAGFTYGLDLSLPRGPLEGLI